MKRQTIYTWISAAICLLLATTACRQEAENPLPEETGSVTLLFEMQPTSDSRSENNDMINLYYTVKDGEITPCEAPVSIPASRVPDGNTADGGGMADLTVYLVDTDNDIVRIDTFEELDNPITQAINYLDVATGTYTVYAFANTKGNDWFSLPSPDQKFPNESSFYLKGLSGSAPTVNNNRMPLTGKLTLEIGPNASGIRTVSMLRTVGKLTLGFTAAEGKAITLNNLSLTGILPHTGYVFKQNSILPQNATTNPYASITDNEAHTAIPGASHIIYDNYLYEAYVSAGFNVTLGYKGASFSAAQVIDGSLNGIGKEDLFLIKIKEVDLYLKLFKEGSVYQLRAVDASELDEACFWRLGQGGPTNRTLINNYFEVGMQMSNGSISFSNGGDMFTFGDDRTGYSVVLCEKGNSSNQLTYNSTNGTFSVSSNGTPLQFFSYTEEKNNKPFTVNALIYKDVATQAPLIEIHRNQHVNVTLTFQ